MSRKLAFLLLLAFCVSVVQPGLGVTTQANDLVPAGTILYCTLDEPNLSSKTAMIGDPILCSLGPLRSFGHLVFPRGAQLGGHLQDYKNPGHFVGKGSLSIEFDRIILPNAEVLPLTAKLVSAPHQKVDAQGLIRGKGHPKRDAALWAIPVFWPVKICTLPARGPSPALKGESRLGLRLMEDVEVPLPTVAKNSVPKPPWVDSSNIRPGADVSPASSESPRLLTPVTSSAVTEATTQPITVIALQSGAAVLARDYWLDGAKLHCVLQDGAEQDLPIAALDFVETLKLNQTRNVTVSLHAKGVVEQ
jgi:hypothetical protein